MILPYSYVNIGAGNNFSFLKRKNSVVDVQSSSTTVRPTTASLEVEPEKIIHAHELSKALEPQITSSLFDVESSLILPTPVGKREFDKVFTSAAVADALLHGNSPVIYDRRDVARKVPACFGGVCRIHPCIDKSFRRILQSVFGISDPNIWVGHPGSSVIHPNSPFSTGLSSSLPHFILLFTSLASVASLLASLPPLPPPPLSSAIPIPHLSLSSFSPDLPFYPLPHCLSRTRSVNRSPLDGLLLLSFPQFSWQPVGSGLFRFPRLACSPTRSPRALLPPLFFLLFLSFFLLSLLPPLRAALWRRSLSPPATRSCALPYPLPSRTPPFPLPFFRHPSLVTPPAPRSVSLLRRTGLCVGPAACLLRGHGPHPALLLEHVSAPVSARALRSQGSARKAHVPQKEQFSFARCPSSGAARPSAPRNRKGWG
jgi:hypothetical protein